MDQRIVEILMYVIGEIQSRKIQVDEIEGISDELMQRGFSQREVATAFSFFMNRMNRDVNRLEVSQPERALSYRVLHDVERQYVGPEAHGYLIQLSHLGLLNMTDVEELVERCMIMGNLNIGGEEMKMLVATHLLEKDIYQGEPGYSASPARPWPEHIH
jgi:uncharacterized protein Smg (DUF494 family)